MIIPYDAVISLEKMRDYLLKPLETGDKSKYLISGGYSRSDPERLSRDIREQLLPAKGIFQEQTLYGDKFIVEGYLQCPNGMMLGVKTIWERDDEDGTFRFITLFPRRR
jgi:hypothetical protein